MRRNLQAHTHNSWQLFPQSKLVYPHTNWDVSSNTRVCVCVLCFWSTPPKDNARKNVVEEVFSMIVGATKKNENRTHNTKMCIPLYFLTILYFLIALKTTEIGYVWLLKSRWLSDGH